MNTTRTIGLLAAGLTALLVTACGTATTTSPTGAGSAGPVSAEHNDADVTFVQGMIPHHTQAVAMAQMATGQTTSPQVKDLAARIEQAQGPEIGQMRGFLAAWGVTEDPQDVAGMGTGMDHGGMGGMSGMMTPEHLTQLGQMTGVAFDRRFLQMMTEHHTGAVGMAETEQRDGQNSDAKTLAQQIIDAQRAEITEMQGLLTTL